MRSSGIGGCGNPSDLFKNFEIKDYRAKAGGLTFNDFVHSEMRTTNKKSRIGALQKELEELFSNGKKADLFFGMDLTYRWWVDVEEIEEAAKVIGLKYDHETQLVTADENTVIDGKIAHPKLMKGDH